ncbi:MAG: hypothetical protein ACTSX6_14060 [Candidatus Heimdallarchaeaceae archaeon]
MDRERDNELTSVDLEDETSSLLVESVLDSLEQVEAIDEDFKIIYFNDQITYEQFNRIYKVASFILENIFPFPNSEKEQYKEGGKVYSRIRVSDEEGFLHTCFFEMLFSHNKEYIIQPKTCGCSMIDSIVNLFLPSILSLDLFKICICLQSLDYVPKEFQSRFISLIKMYAGNNFVEAWTHIGYLAEQITRKIYLNKYHDKNEDEVKNENWNRLLKRLQNEKSDPFVQHAAFLIDSIRPLRNEALHHDYNPTFNDVEFGIQCIIRLLKYLMDLK